MRMVQPWCAQAGVAKGTIKGGYGVVAGSRRLLWEIANQGIHGVKRKSMGVGHV